MKNKMWLLASAVLALAVLMMSTGSIISAPMFGNSMFSSPAFGISHTGFNQLAPSQVGRSPILFAPSMSQLFSVPSVGSHIRPMLETQNRTSSLKTSPVNQMFAMMSMGLGKKKTK